MIETLDSGSQKISEYLGTATRPVGIKLIRLGDRSDNAAYDEASGSESFCWYVHEAAKGKNFLIRRKDLDCNKAEIVLGFRGPMFANIEPRIREKILGVRIGPTDNADAVMLILNPEQGMTLGNLIGGLKVTFKWNRTVCGEGMAQVYNTKQPTMTLLCIGARTDGDFEADELLVTLPYKVFIDLPSRMGKFSSMSRKAIDSMAERFRRHH